MANPKDQNPSQKPAAGKPAAGKPIAGKPAAKPAGKAATAKKPPKPVRGGDGASARGGGRRLGQVLVDLGYVDEDQLWDVLEEAKNTSQKIGQAALARGLINEDQLLQALADQHGLKVANLEEFKPQSEA